MVSSWCIMWQCDHRIMRAYSIFSWWKNTFWTLFFAASFQLFRGNRQGINNPLTKKERLGSGSNERISGIWCSAWARFNSPVWSEKNNMFINLKKLWWERNAFGQKEDLYGRIGFGNKALFSAPIDADVWALIGSGTKLDGSYKNEIVHLSEFQFHWDFERKGGKGGREIELSRRNWTLRNDLSTVRSRSNVFEKKFEMRFLSQTLFAPRLFNRVS